MADVQRSDLSASLKTESKIEQERTKKHQNTNQTNTIIYLHNLYCSKRRCHHLLATGKMHTTTQKKNTDSIPAKTTPPVTPNANPHNEDTMTSLTARIDMLENRVLELEGVLEVTRNANSLLEQEVDNLQQYQRRACIIVDGITPVKDEMEEQITAKTKNFLIKNLGFEERKVNEELDKCHRLGKAKDGKQSTIIRFKSH